MERVTKLTLSIPASPAAYEEITVTNAAISPTSINVERCTFAIVLYERGPIRFRDDGTDPTSAVGTPQFDGNQEIYSVATMRKIRWIRAGGTNGTLRIRYYS